MHPYTAGSFDPNEKDVPAVLITVPKVDAGGELWIEPDLDGKDVMVGRCKLTLDLIRLTPRAVC